MRLVLTLFFLSFLTCSVAQNFREKTNDVQVSFKNPSANTSMPMITWIQPRMEYTNSQKGELTVEAEVKGDVPIAQIEITLIDAKDQTEQSKTATIEANKNIQTVRQDFNLPDGQHTIKITATNSTGGKASSTRVVLIGDAIANAVAIDRKDYAILFATDKYDHWSDLVNPVEDANAIAMELKAKYGFDIEVVENPNQEDVFIKISEYVQKSYKPQDQLMIFFAGHGYFDDAFGEGFVVAKNSLENDKARTSYISHSRLRSVINNIPCEHIFLAMDVCFGGTFDPVIARERGATSAYTEASQTEFLVRKLSYKTRKYLTSGGKTYVSDGIAGKHSPFAMKFIQALGDSGGSDHVLTLDELRAYVEKLVPEPRAGSFGDDNQASDFIFVLNQK